MRLTLPIALRFLFAKRRAMLMSLAGIVFGVAFFIVTQAQTSGFENFFIQTVWGTRGAIRVQDAFQYNVTSLVAHGENEEAGFRIPLREGRTYIPGIQHPRTLIEAIWRYSEVVGVSEVLRGPGEATSGFRTESCDVHGIRLRDHLSVTDLGSQIKYGDLATFELDRSAALIGTMLARRLELDVGGTLLVKGVAETRRFRVAAIFETGVEAFDKRQVYTHLTEARYVLGEPVLSSYLQVNLRDNNQAERIASHMEEALDHHVVPWQRSEKTWLEVFRALRLSSGITMSVIILIAGLGMFNTLAIIVMERRKEIAILRSMGYTRKEVVQVFLNQGILVLIAGTILGWALAAGMTWGIENLPIRIRGIFASDNFVVKWAFSHYLLATLVATVVVLIAAWLPARKAAQIEPGEIIRGTGG